MEAKDPPSLHGRPPLCFDCKWSLLSKVGKACDCNFGHPGQTNADGATYDREAFETAFKEARELQEQGVDLKDQRYY
jgi:hypothetical protein